MLKRSDVATVFVCLVFVHFLVSLYTLYTVSEGTATTRRGYLGVLRDTIQFPSLSLKGFGYYSDGDLNIGSLPSSNLIATVVRSAIELDAATVLGYSLRQSVSCLDHVNRLSGDNKDDDASPTGGPTSRVYCIARLYYDSSVLDVRQMVSSVHNGTVDLTAKLQQAGWMEVIPLNLSTSSLDPGHGDRGDADLFTSLFLEFDDPRFKFRQMLYISPRAYCNTDLSILFDSDKPQGLLPHYAPAGGGDNEMPTLTVLCLTAADFYSSGDEPVLFMAVPIPGMRRDHQNNLRFACRGDLAAGERFAPKLLVDLSRTARRRSSLFLKAPRRDYDWYRHIDSKISFGFFNRDDFMSMMRSVAPTNFMETPDDVEQRLWWGKLEAAAEHAQRRMSRSMYWSNAQNWVAKAGSSEGLLAAVGTELESVVATQASMLELLNLTSPQMRLQLGKPGESCLQACAAINYGCAPKALDWWLPNSCEMLQRLFVECDKCTVDLSGKGVAPAYRQADSLCIARYARSRQRASCNASLPGYSRACTCFETNAQFSAVVRKLSPQDLDLLFSKNATEKRQALPGGDLPAVPPLSADDAKRAIKVKPGESCPCPVSSAYGRTEEEEWQCLGYLGNFSNVAKIEPMLSNLKFGRTAKYQIVYENPCVRAIAKPPQKSFPLEPYAEYVAFEIDRLLQLKYVPPTTWLFLPLMLMESAAEFFKNGGTEGAKSAKSYASWLSEEVMEYAVQHRLTTIDPNSHKMVLGCSVQLWVDGARWHRATPLEYDDAYISLLTQESAKLHEQGKLVSNPSVRKAILNTDSKVKNVEKVLPYISDTVIFDTILANDDRSSQKNSHVYRHGLENEYRYLHLDQGKSFYQQRVVSKFTLNDLDDDPSKEAVGFQSICMFRTTTTKLLKQLSSGGLMRRLTDLVPAPIRQQFSNNQLHWAQARVDAIQRHVDLCVKKVGEEAALPWKF